VCEDSDVLCIDPTARIHAFLRGEPDPGAHFRCHYSTAIHARIADEIASVLGAAGSRTSGAVAARRRRD
jgi:hypothetical protein